MTITDIVIVLVNSNRIAGVIATVTVTVITVTVAVIVITNSE